MEESQEIISLIANGETENAIQKFNEIAPKNNKDVFLHLQLLSNQYQVWNKNKLLGLISDDTELNRINLALLNLLYSVNKNEIDRRESGTFNQEHAKLERLLKDETKTTIVFKRKKEDSILFGISLYGQNTNKIPLKIYFDGKYLGEIKSQEEIFHKTVPGIHYVDFELPYEITISNGRTGSDTYEKLERLNFGSEFDEFLYGIDVVVKKNFAGYCKLSHEIRKISKLNKIQ